MIRRRTRTPSTAMTPELGLTGTLGAALLAGLAGSGHCLGMCGGIAGAMGAGCPASGLARGALMLGFNFGRVLSYGLLGALFGLLAGLGVSWTGGQGLTVLRVIAGLLLIAIGVHMAFQWRGLDHIANLAAPAWNKLSPVFGSLLPLRRQPQAWALGLMWGLLPCGLVYAMLATAATTASATYGALVMTAFGLGTLPSMLTTSLGGQALLGRLRGPVGRRIAGALMIAFGLLTVIVPIWMAISSGGHHHH